MDDWIFRLRTTMRLREIERETRRAFWTGVLLTTFAFALLAVSLIASAETIPPDAGRYQRDLTRTWRGVWGMRAPVATAAAQIHQESLWRQDAQSYAGAKGLTQFMPRTAEWIQGQYGGELGPLQPFNPTWGMRAQARYMRLLWDDLSGLDGCERMAFALGSYNGGIGWMRKRIAMSTTPAICLGATCTINPGILDSNQRQNEEYSVRVLLVLSPIYAARGWGLQSCAAGSS